uniref:WLM domain-containing protein n=1 Tax=Megaviridae environmental sample TaxID=1737588 RepID=A0A5J6VMU1_9VIRU|nr:MAG: hypothetical protein [Megaviridae environmental sample]
MKESIFITLVLVLVYIFILVNKKNLKLVEYNGYRFLIQNTNSPTNNLTLLAEIVKRLFILRNFLIQKFKAIDFSDIDENIINKITLCKDNDTSIYKNECIKGISNFLSEDEFKLSIKILEKNFSKERTIISENINESQYTSYSVNKGEEIVFCLKSRQNKKIHHVNLLMYVAIHELAHCGCIEIGHTNLYNRIFKVYLLVAIQLNLYKYDDYSKSSVEYCGMIVNSHILSTYDYYILKN